MSDLPQSWIVTTINNVVSAYSVIDPTKTPEEIFTYIDIGSIDNVLQKIVGPKTFKGANAPSRARRVVQVGDTLFSTVRTYLKNIAIVPIELDGALTSTGIAVLRPNISLDPLYLFYWAISDAFVKEIARAEDGTVYPAVRDADVTAGVIPLAPLPEQRRIVAKLDSLLARSARARQELGRVPNLIKRYKQAILAKAFSGELTADWRVAQSIRDDWATQTIMQVAEVITGTTPPTAEKGRYFDGSIPFFKPTDLDAGFRVCEPRETLTDAGADRARRVPAGSTLVTCIGATIAKTGFARVDCCTNQQINALVPDRSIVHPEWLYWMVISPDFRGSILGNASATTLPIINKGRFERLAIRLPTKDEQEEIARRVESSFRWFEKIAAEHARAAHLLPKLDQAILAKAFRGELVPQDPNDEPASVLLARVQGKRAATERPKRVPRGITNQSG